MARHSVLHPVVRRSAFLWAIVLTLGLAFATATAASAQAGVTLYDRQDYRGFSETFYGHIADLGRESEIGSDRARSVRIDPGCRAFLYEDVDFEGLFVLVDRDIADLRRSRLGLDSASSLRVDCSGDLDRVWSDDPWDGRRDDDPQVTRGSGAMLFDDADFRGTPAAVDRDIADLRQHDAGNDRVSSLQVAPGCQVTLYTDIDYRGRSFSTTRDIADMGSTPIGNDALSSMRVRCDRWDSAFEPGEVGGRGLTVFSDIYFGGRAEQITEDIENLEGHPIGNDTISSLRVSPGCQATLYRDARFQGTSSVIEGDRPDLRGTRVGNDSVSSITVRCRRARR